MLHIWVKQFIFPWSNYTSSCLLNDINCHLVNLYLDQMMISCKKEILC